jgi:predicted HicB family RNase H-like nuclease
MTTTKVQIRASEEQVREWKEAAWIRKVSLSEWIRKVLDATAQQTKGS